jgi:hypothetical protein
MEQTSSNDTYPEDPKPERHARLQITKPVIIGIALTLVVAIIFTAFLVFRNRTPKSSHPIATVSTATPTVTVTATVNALKTPLPSQGWITVPELNYAKSLAFSQSNPLIGYACGNIGSNRTALLEVSTTHDGGRTWQGPTTTTVPGASCYIYINPTNPQDIIMLNDDCWGGCGDDINRPFRSQDSGQTWTQLQLPGDNGNEGTISQPAWIGNTVYFIIESLPPVGPTHPIVANTVGDSLTPVNDEQLFAGTSSADVNVESLWASDDTLFITMNAYSALTFAKTSDNGKTWQKFNGTGIVPSYLFTYISTPNAPLLGFSENTTPSSLVMSLDNGITWKQLPTIPNARPLIDYTNIRIASNGTIFSQVNDSIWELTPGSTSWKIASQKATGLITISTDTAAHPILVWGGASDAATAPDKAPQPGIAYHGLNP